MSVHVQSVVMHSCIGGGYMMYWLVNGKYVFNEFAGSHYAKTLETEAFAKFAAANKDVLEPVEVSLLPPLEFGQPLYICDAQHLPRLLTEINPQLHQQQQQQQSKKKSHGGGSSVSHHRFDTGIERDMYAELARLQNVARAEQLAEKIDQVIENVSDDVCRIVKRRRRDLSLIIDALTTDKVPQQQAAKKTQPPEKHPYCDEEEEVMMVACEEEVED
jgi:hypothetical protein